MMELWPSHLYFIFIYFFKLILSSFLFPLRVTINAGSIHNLVEAYSSSGTKTGSLLYSPCARCFIFILYFSLPMRHSRGKYFIIADTGKRRVGLVGDAAAGFKGRSANTPFRVVYRLVGRRMCIFLVNEFRTTSLCLVRDGVVVVVVFLYYSP